MTLSLTVISLVCAALLGLVYSVTKAPIEAADLEKVNGGIKAVLPQFDNNPYQERISKAEGEIYPATLAGTPVGYAVKVSVSGFGGPLTVMVGFTPDGTVYNTSVISHSETPGLGAKIADAAIAPRVQVAGKNPGISKVSVTKDGGEIDAITASTITSRAFLKGVNDAYTLFKEAVPAEPETFKADSQDNELK